MAPATRSHLEGMLSVSRRVAAAGDLTETLNHIAYEAVRVMDARGATIQLMSRSGRLQLGGAWGVSAAYRSHLDSRFLATGEGAGPTGLALTHRRQVVVPNIQTDPDLVAWRRLTRAAGYWSLSSTPLDVDGDVVGALNVYRGRPGAWPASDLHVLSFFSDHAAIAVRIANLIDRQERQLAGLARVVRGLREQTHEHANRVHSIGALVSLGDHEEARRFIAQLLQAHTRSREDVVAGIEHPALAGLLLAESAIALQTGIQLKIDRRSNVKSLPGGLSEAESVFLIGRLLEHAFEAIVDVVPARRKVTFRGHSDSRGAIFHVRDWGSRMPSMAQVALIDGVEFKPRDADHRLPSLTQSLLLEAVNCFQGTLTFVPENVGTTVVVSIPRQSRTNVQPPTRGLAQRDRRHTGGPFRDTARA